MKWASMISAALVALVIGFSLGSFVFPLRTNTGTMTASLQAGRLYELVFTQEGACSSRYWVAPWSVALNNKTVLVRPANAVLPLSEVHVEASHSFMNYSVIEFSVPNGTYYYVVKPSTWLGQAGTVTVDGTEVIVMVHPPNMSCPTQTQTG